jgi:hypothetical protein
MASAERTYIPEGAESFRAPVREKPKRKLPAGWRIIEGGNSKVSVGTNKRFENGAAIAIGKKEVKMDPLPPGGHTARAETKHWFLADYYGIGVKVISIIPEGDSNGHVIPDKYHPVVASAHINDGGGGWDAFVVEANGDNARASAKIADGITARGEEEIRVVSNYLETEKPVISGAEAKEVVEVYKAKKREVEESKNIAIATITNDDGTVFEIETPIERGYVEIPNAAVIFSTEAHSYNEADLTKHSEPGLSRQQESDMLNAA